MSEELRAVSTLHTPKDFLLSKADRNSGFMFFYTAAYKEHIGKFVASLVLQGALPKIQDSRFLDDIAKRELVGLSDFYIGTAPSKATSSILRQSSDASRPGYEFEFVLSYFSMDLGNADVQTSLLKLVSGANLHLTDDGVPTPVNGKIVTGNELEKNCKSLSTDTLREVGKVFKELRYETAGLYTTVWATVYISKAIVEYMTSTPMVSLRPSNLYVLLLGWIKSKLGNVGKVPTSSVPITRIAKEVTEISQGKEVAARNKNNGIVALDDGSLAWIPDVDQSDMYEQALHDYGYQEDGSYCFNPPKSDLQSPTEIKIGDMKTGKKLPVNMPIFTDWVNLKFAYSNTEGGLGVLDLDRCVKLQPFHVRTVLERPINSAEAKNFIRMLTLMASAFSLDVDPTAEEIQPVEKYLPLEKAASLSPMAYCEMVPDLYAKLKVVPGIVSVEDIRLHHISEDSEIGALRCVARLAKAVKAAVENDYDKAYRSISVVSFIEAYAILKLVTLYASKIDTVIQADVDRRNVYLKQGVDPDYKQEKIPFMRKGAFMLPHQAKTANLMRSNPPFAIYSVDAGGGKTSIILTNILKELHLKHCKRPIIMCPAHLVQGYVKEAVYFTEGRVNMIAITSYTIRQNGFARIQKMIQVAPINTIFITDYDFIKQKAQVISYGVKPITVFRNVEFLRQFKFDLVAADEAHYLKNDSIRTDAANRLMSEIPRKRLASGTLVTDTPMDIVAETSLLDPTIFGTRADFMNKYADDVKGDKVMAWKEGAARNIRYALQEHAVFVDCRRKEWATLLPDPEEMFYAVDLTPKQLELYHIILDKILDQLKEKAEKNPTLKKLLDNADDEENAEKLADLFKTHLSRLEVFLAAPSKDPAGATLTDPLDRVSPKVRKIIELCYGHINQNIPGKILIFTNHVKVAEDIYDNFPPDLKKMAIHYTAAEKLECGADFEKNPSKKIMVGVEKSMNTGLNLQFASRLIRIETVWTPGELEQGNSRINRPELKTEDVRKQIFLDTIVANRTYDITKISRLISKMIQKAKFDEPHNPEFQALEEPPMMSMTFDTVRTNNDFNNELQPYLLAYQGYKNVLHADYRDYREKNRDKMKPVPLERGEDLVGSKLMARTPYVPDMAIYGASELGLLRYDEFMRLDTESLEGDDEAEDDDEDDDSEEDDLDINTGPMTEDQKKELKLKKRLAQKAKNEAELNLVKGMGVHTEFGEGIIEKLGKLRVRVRFPNGDMVRVRKLACFLVTRRDTNTKDIRKQLLKMAGDYPISAPIDVPATGIKVSGRPSSKYDDETDDKPIEKKVQINLYFTYVNDFLAMGLHELDDQDAVGALANFGFKTTPQHYTAQVRSPQNLLKLYKAWNEAGFRMPKAISVSAQELYSKLKNKAAMRLANIGTKLSLRNFLLGEFKSASDPTLIKPYPMIRDDILYIGLPKRNQAGTIEAMRVKVPTIRWVLASPEMLRFVTSKQEVVDVLKKIIGAGIEVVNIDDLGKSWKKIRFVRAPEVEKDDDE